MYQGLDTMIERHVLRYFDKSYYMYFLNNFKNSLQNTCPRLEAHISLQVISTRVQLEVDCLALKVFMTKLSANDTHTNSNG